MVRATNFTHSPSVIQVKPRSINIFLLDGDPDGIRIAQISMSTIQAIAFRRNKLGEVRKTVPEAMIVETLIEEAMRLAEEMGEPVDLDDDAGTTAVKPIVTVS